MADKNLRIKISAELQNKGISELRSMLKATQQEMDKLVQSGGRGSQAFNDLKVRASVLSQTINGLSREFRGLDKDVKLSGMALFELFENATVVTAGLSQAFSQIKSTLTEFIDEYKKLEATKLSLENVANFKGVSTTAINNQIQSLDIVKNGLLTFSEAAQSVSNLMRSGLNLDQSINLLKGFTDSAVFGRQASLDLGYAVVSGTEGWRNNNNMLLDNMGMTTNISILNKRAGLTQKELDNKVNDSTVTTRQYNEVIKELAISQGNAEKYAKTFAGQQASLNATITTIKQNFGELISKAISPFFEIIKDGNGNFSHTVIIFGGIISTITQLLPLMAALRIAFQGLQVSMGWISVIGLAIAGLIIVIENFVTASGKMQKVVKQTGQEMMKNEKTTKDQEKVLASLNIVAENTADAYDKIANAIQGMTYTQLRTTRDFIQAEKDKVEAVIQAQILMERARLKGAESGPYGSADDYIKTFESTQKNIVYGEKIEQLNNLLREADSKIISGKYGSSDTKTNTDKKKGGKDNSENKITTDLSRLQEDLVNTKKEFELLKQELTTQNVVWDKNTVAIREYLNAIADLESQIAFKKLNFKDLKIPDIVDLPSFDNTTEIPPIEVPIELTARIQEQDKKKADDERQSLISSEQYQNTLLVFDTLGDALRNSLNSAWSDTFGEANSLFEQFMQNVTTALINSLITKAISGILNLIFPGSGLAFGAISGRATGGEVRANKPYFTGERGVELFVPQIDGRVLNHSDTMRVLNSQAVNNSVANQPQVTEKYFALEQDGIRFLEKNYPHYKSKKLFKQL